MARFLLSSLVLPSGMEKVTRCDAGEKTFIRTWSTSIRLNESHVNISYGLTCLSFLFLPPKYKKQNKTKKNPNHSVPRMNPHTPQCPSVPPIAPLQGHVGEGRVGGLRSLPRNYSMDDGAKKGERMDNLVYCLLHILMTT